jgi:hypothetical protein
MVTPGEIAEKDCDFSISIPLPQAANRGWGQRVMTGEEQEKSFQAQRVAQKGGVAGLTGDDSSFGRGGFEENDREAEPKKRGQRKESLESGSGGSTEGEQDRRIKERRERQGGRGGEGWKKGQ